MERHRSLFVMVRLDRTIGVPKIALTGVFVRMVRSSRTMTMEGGYHTSRRAILARMGSSPGMTGDAKVSHSGD
jgi:hypothetical protein